jgi:tetraacyldisaccharide 4'-kinase
MLDKLQRAWYKKEYWVWSLFPFTLLFWLLSSARRRLFQIGLLSSKNSNIPVVVVGNIGIGGNGKTPLVLALVKELRIKGYTPAVLSRGYGGNQSAFPHLLNEKDSANLVGDEPALICQREHCITVIDPIRARGVSFIEQHTKADIVICDDGLQHYAMKRDIEICVLDKRGVGNGYLLPMGPLREGKWRLAKVDAVVHNIGTTCDVSHAYYTHEKNSFEMDLQPSCWVNVHTKEKKSVQEFRDYIAQQGINLSVTALAGIGDPKRFFDTIRTMNIVATITTSFPDHHAFSEQDIPSEGCVLMTEKDAVKCVNFERSNAWYLQIDAALSDDFFRLVEEGISAKTKGFVKSRA